MKKLIILVLAFWCNQIVYCQSDITILLFDLCDVSFKEIETANGFERSFLLMVKQPIDHLNPHKGYFRQKVYLNHSSLESPVVQVTEGYNRNSNRIYELTEFIGANQVTVEHRYFGASVPDTLDYDYLNFEQVTADHHKINQLMKEIYTGKFIATGISKGGTTSIFYRYFYPKDVDVTVPYVAPLNRELEESRIYEFLRNKGDEKCRADILAFQKRILNNRTYCLDRLKWFVKGKGLKFNYLNMEQAFEYAVLEYPFSFWQWGTDCDSIPNKDAKIDTDINHLLDVSGLDFFSDQSMKAYASHYYQSGTQMGYYGYETTEFKGLLPALSGKKNPSAVFMPNKMEAQWDSTLTTKVYEWVLKEGNNFIYINGLDDTWSATRVPQSNQVNSLWFDLKGESHGTARIKNFSKEQKKLLKDTLDKWLD